MRRLLHVDGHCVTIPLLVHRDDIHTHLLDLSSGTSIDPSIQSTGRWMLLLLRTNTVDTAAKKSRNQEPNEESTAIHDDPVKCDLHGGNFASGTFSIRYVTGSITALVPSINDPK